MSRKVKKIECEIVNFGLSIILFYILFSMLWWWKYRIVTRPIGEQEAKKILTLRYVSRGMFFDC